MVVLSLDKPLRHFVSVCRMEDLCGKCEMLSCRIHVRYVLEEIQVHCVCVLNEVLPRSPFLLTAVVPRLNCSRVPFRLR